MWWQWLKSFLIAVCDREAGPCSATRGGPLGRPGVALASHGAPVLFQPEGAKRAGAEVVEGQSRPSEKMRDGASFIGARSVKWNVWNLLTKLPTHARARARGFSRNVPHVPSGQNALGPSRADVLPSHPNRRGRLIRERFLLFEYSRRVFYSHEKERRKRRFAYGF